MPDDSLYDINELLLQVGKGSEPAFRILFDIHKERFYSTSLKMTRSADIAEEIVQEVFVNLWIKRTQVASAHNPGSYLLMMLQNCIYAHFRKLALEKAMKKRVVEQTFAVDASPVEDIFLAKEDREIMESVIGRLPSQQRIVYKLSRQEGLSREQIAGQLHISPNTVKNHLQQAMHFIKTFYKAGASTFMWLAAWQLL